MKTLVKDKLPINLNSKPKKHLIVTISLLICMMLFSGGCELLLTGSAELELTIYQTSHQLDIAVYGNRTAGTSMVFEAVSTQESDLTEFSWYVNGILTGKDKIMTYTFNERGYYRVVLNMVVWLNTEEKIIYTAEEHISAE